MKDEKNQTEIILLLGMLVCVMLSSVVGVLFFGFLMVTNEISKLKK